MIINILTLFPEIFSSVFDASIVGRARGQGKLQVNIVNIRDFAKDSYKSVDDHPFGGGPGMILRVDVVDEALNSLKNAGRKVLLTPRGTQFTQGKATEFSKLEALTLICGHFEGFDQRVHDHLVNKEISCGPYVLTGGEIPAMAVVDAVTRLLPGVINKESLREESFSIRRPAERNRQDSYLEYPQYTKPRDYKGWVVPEVLLTGDHLKIKGWRQSSSTKVPSSSSISISKPSTSASCSGSTSSGPISGAGSKREPHTGQVTSPSSTFCLASQLEQYMVIFPASSMV